MKTVLCIPTLNAGAYASTQTAAIASQSLRPDAVLVIDSGSDDGTVETFREAGALIHSIKRQEFNHGGTRQLGVDMFPDADLIVFLTQDAILADPDALVRLSRCFDDPEVGVAFGRQLPRLGAGAIEAHARLFNYPDASRVTTLADRAAMGIKTVFLSNSFAAYRRGDLLAVGGFPSHLIMGEDTYVAAKMLLAGKKVAYSAGATVLHSHDYNLVEEFRRYFDAGVLHAREPWIREHFGGAENEGLRLVRAEMRYLIGRNPFLIPSSILRTMLKWVGFRLGLQEARLPIAVKRQLSLFRAYWSNRGSERIHASGE